MSPLLKEALKREKAFQGIKSRKQEFENPKFDWVDGMLTAAALIILFVGLNII